MSRYYCPFCSTSFQFHNVRSDRTLICSLCGDPLLKKTLLDARRILGLITAIVFFTPLLLMIILLIKEFSWQEIQNESESIAILSLNVDNGK